LNFAKRTGGDNDMHKVLFTEKIHSRGMDILRAETEIIVADNTNKDTLVAAIVDMDALVIRSTKLYNEIIDASNKLKVIARHGIGLDNIDVD
jgi:D-3-phosphoglycerate dehydrogenase